MSSYATGSDETLVNSYTTNDQFTPSVTALSDGGWVVTWWGEGTEDGPYGIFQQRYDMDGHTIGSETLVNSYTTNSQSDARITALDDGGWVVTWKGEGTGDDDGIFQQRYAANGSTIGSETLVNSYTSNSQLAPTTTALNDGGWVVTWYGVGTGDDVGIFQQRFAADGSTMGSQILVNSYTTNGQIAPTTTALADGGWVVTWCVEGAEDDVGIFQQRYTVNGDTVGSQTLVNSYTTHDQTVPVTTALADGGWVVTWQGEGPGDGYGIFQQRHSADGNAVGAETLVNLYTTGLKYTPAITALADGGWVVVWDGEGPGDSLGIFQQRYAANGDAVGGETLVNAHADNGQYSPMVTGLADGSWVVTWQGEGSGDSNGIFQRHFAIDVDGTSHADVLTGTNWGEYLIGYAGNDKLDGQGGNDILVGGIGNDTYIVNSSGDQVQERASQGTDSVFASASFTLVGSVENLTLTGKGAISGTGNGLANIMTGNTGANTLTGAGGADTMTGGKGNDQLLGGTGGDHFIFNSGDGGDTIKDFTAIGVGHDVIDLSHVSGLTDFADLKAHHMEQAGSSVVINYTAHDSVTLESVKIKDLSAADFAF